nr:F-box protein At3g07870-like [Quercus suber]POE88907.1 f-box protein [Quercus suber]
MTNSWDSGLTQDPVTSRSSGFIVIVLRSAWPDSHVRKLVGVYSLSTGSWRQVEHDPKMIYGILPYRHMTAYMNGLFFWLAAEEDDVDDNRIVAFDFSTEVFNMTPLPDKSVIGSWRSLVLLNGFIAMVIYSSLSDNLGFEIWVLLEFGVEESWTKLLTIDPSLDLKRPLLFWKSGQIFMENTKGQLVLYDPFTQTTKNFQLDGHEGPLRVVPYTV